MTKAKFDGFVLKELRKGHGLTQEQLGVQLGVTKAAVSNIELGADPSGRVLFSILKLFGVESLDRLYAEEVVDEIKEGVNNIG